MNSRPANTSEYAATTHWSCDSVAPRSRESVGRATFRVELPPNTISRLRQSTASVHHRRAYACSAEWPSEGEVSSAMPPSFWQQLPDIANRQVTAVANRHSVSEWSSCPPRSACENARRPARARRCKDAAMELFTRHGLRRHHGRGDRGGLRGVAPHVLPLLPHQGGRALRRRRQSPRQRLLAVLAERPAAGASVRRPACGDAGAGVGLSATTAPSWSPARRWWRARRSSRPTRPSTSTAGRPRWSTRSSGARSSTRRSPATSSSSSPRSAPRRCASRSTSGLRTRPAPSSTCCSTARSRRIERGFATDVR